MRGLTFYLDLPDEYDGKGELIEQEVVRRLCSFFNIDALPEGMEVGCSVAGGDGETIEIEVDLNV